MLQIEECFSNYIHFLSSFYFLSGCMYNFIFVMVLIARCVKSEVSLTTEQCSPVTVTNNLASDFQLNDQISNLSERVQALQRSLYGAIQHYGPQVSYMYCIVGVVCKK